MAFLSVALGSYPNISNPQMIVINSFEDVLQYKINPLSVLWGFDFEKYTLIGGGWESWAGDTVFNVKLCKNIQSQEYTFTLTTRMFCDHEPDFCDCISLPTNSYHYYWRLYPKLDTNLKINLIRETQLLEGN